jgi:hypothetical protein
MLVTRPEETPVHALGAPRPPAAGRTPIAPSNRATVGRRAACVRNVKTIGMVLAGGKGTRLHPLTWKRTKPAVPFGSKYRIIDFALNNMINSGIYGMYVLTQFKAQSLTEHIQRNWRFGTFLSDYFITLAPAQMYLYEELGAEWYRGTADAIYQNLHLIDNSGADLVAIFSGDHIYKMDISHMIEYHLEHEADVTIAAYPTPRRRHPLRRPAGRRDWRITEFQEKPANRTPSPAAPPTAWRRWATTSSRSPSSRDAHRDARAQGQRARLRQERAPAWRSRTASEALRLRLRAQPDPRPGGPRTRTGATSARSTRTGRRTWTWSRAARVRPLQRSMAAAHLGRVLATREVRARGGGAARPGASTASWPAA